MTSTPRRRAGTAAATLAAALVSALGFGVAGVQPASATGPCAGSFNVITGGAGNDVLDGTPGRDWIEGRGGDDLIRGHGGNDVLVGGPGHDRIIGGKGVDCLSGNGGDDYLAGHQDTWEGQPRGDVIDGGTGEDTGWWYESQNSSSVEKSKY